MTFVFHLKFTFHSRRSGRDNSSFSRRKFAAYLVWFNCFVAGASRCRCTWAPGGASSAYLLLAICTAGHSAAPSRRRKRLLFPRTHNRARFFNRNFVDRKSAFDCRAARSQQGLTLIPVGWLGARQMTERLQLFIKETETLRCRP